MRTHVDLFSGIGGFALAARANGVQTLSFCEIDDKCRAFLSRAWPGVDIHDDVRTFDGLQYRGATWLLTAGVPCQPASRAGKQRGAADDRWLWPQAIRVLSAVRPTWALLENPPGIGDVGLAGILADVEGEGYEVRVHSIPACAVGAPHRRERYWIVCHRGVGLADSSSAGHQGPDAEPGAHGLCAEYLQGNLADTLGVGRQWAIAAGNDRRQPKETHRDGSRLADWNNYVWLPCADGKLRRAPDNTFGLVDGLHRSVLAALGNSIVPAVAERIIQAMIIAEEQE